MVRGREGCQGPNGSFKCEIEGIGKMRKIFVFGSNRQGRHGKGAALAAVREHGAVYGQGEGLQGDAYAIPTKETPYQSLSLAEIWRGVDRFIRFAIDHPEMKFTVTAIGTGLAGYTDDQIGPMFAGAPKNCLLPVGFEGAIKRDG